MSRRIPSRWDLRSTKPDLRILLVAVVVAVVAGILNNLRLPESRRVDWFGGQPVFDAPEGEP